MTSVPKINRTNSTQRAAHIRTLLSSSDPFLSLAQAARRAGIPLSSLSQAVTSGKVSALIMPDRRRYVAWSDVEKFVTHTRSHQAPKAHILLRLVELANQESVDNLPADFATNHDKYIHDVTQ